MPRNHVDHASHFRLHQSRDLKHGIGWGRLRIQGIGCRSHVACVALPKSAASLQEVRRSQYARCKSLEVRTEVLVLSRVGGIRPGGVMTPLAAEIDSCIC
jgi:hypothetical protein